MSEQQERGREQHERRQEPPPGQQPATAELEAEIARLEDRFKRALADLDNYRKRAAKDVERQTAQATDALLTDWLQVADSVDRALSMDAEGPDGDGMRAVREQIDSTLARQHVRRIGEVGERFDPEHHEAVDVRTTEEVPDHTVVEVVRSGYAHDERVLRPALVAVSQRPRAAPTLDEPAG